MNPLHLIPVVVVAIIVSLAFPAQGLAADTPAPAAAQIEALLLEIQSLKDASFVRNDAVYDAKTAARFLRGKWDSNKKEIATAEDFIEKAASVSSTTGKPYLIRFTDGKEVKCGDFLRLKLKKIKSTKP